MWYRYYIYFTNVVETNNPLYEFAIEKFTVPSGSDDKKYNDNQKNILC